MIVQCYLMIPDWHDSPIFKNANPLAAPRRAHSGQPRAGGMEEPVITHPEIAKRVSQYLMAVLQAEVEHGSHAPLRTDNTADKTRIKDRFMLQFRVYARNDYPFNLFVHQEGQTALQWWTVLQSAEAANLLAVSRKHMPWPYPVALIPSFDRLSLSRYMQWFRTQWQTNAQHRDSLG